ncbi:MAG TPA: lipoate--protein ligase family protein [Verrucomicrobiae bacterium]|nr:lipoate--protein ligase family protein [Verrucomicrobiae bacterium]
MQEWRLLYSGYSNGALNMAIDEAIAMAVAGGEAPPTIRFYGWVPACLSLGYAQRAEEVEWEACTARGIDVVRRPTGGRAILHDREVTYSVIAKEDNPLVSGTILESYLKISRGLLAGLNKLGIPAEMVSHKDLDKLGTAACFDSPSWYEIVVNGKKMVGSAQTRKSGVVLQHGSIIRDMDADTLFEVLAFANPETRNRLKEVFRRKACSVREVIQRDISDADIIAGMTDGFKQAFEVELRLMGLSEREQELARELVDTKYGNAEWTKKR